MNNYIKNDKKVVVLSFQRNATQSTQQFLNSNGFPGIHHITERVDTSIYQNKNIYQIQKHTSIYENEYVSFSDAPYFLMYEYFYKKYPNSKFILITRDENEWLKSFKKHSEKGIPCDIVSFECYRHYLKGIKRDINNMIYNVSDNDLLYMYTKHNLDILKYFNKIESLIHLDINDPYKSYKLCKFLNIDHKSVFNKIDYLENIKGINEKV